MPVKQDTRDRLRIAFERKRQVEQAERNNAQELRSAMDFFRWKVRPVVGYCQGLCDPILGEIRQLNGFIPFSPLDAISGSLHDKAQAAYKVLLAAEEQGDAEVRDYWEQPYWQQETLKVISFGKRLCWQEGQKAQFIIWVDARDNRQVMAVVDKIDSTAPRFFDREDD